MNNIQYFFKKAIISCKKGKFYYRPWKQFIQIIFLETIIFLLTNKKYEQIR